MGLRSEDPGNMRSDTLDILKYSLSLDMTEMNANTLKGACTVDFKSKMNNIGWINLDLLQLQVDSIKSSGTHLNFTHNDEIVHVALPQSLNIDDSFQLTVYYRGTPITDATFGGFYFQGGYAYNLGVAFSDDPHNYGRAWFPCFDNFVERSAYDVQVLTNNGRTAYCGGLRTSVESVGQDSLLTSWSLEQEIPTYLASVAVTNYTHVEKSFESISGETIPIWLTARPSDTTMMKQSFVNIASCSQDFEEDYGLYRWPRVGFVLVPFNGGAMEHATNIAYPRFAADGSLAYETLFAHELSHHWWGDLVTCRNAEDMWLNEGWASYSESIFLENQYGAATYLSDVRSKHKDALLNAHRDDGGRYPVSGVPTEITYGSHVYIKGADMAHTLRGYMGDDDFFTAIKAYMEEYQFRDVSSEDMRDFFQGYTDANLTDFFDDWIFQEGYPEYRVRTALNTSGNNWDVIIDQHHHYNPELYNNVPMELTVLDDNGNRHYYDVLLSGASTIASVQLPDGINPSAFFLNENCAISEAVLAENRTITNTATQNFTYAEAILSVMNLGGAPSVMVRVENHFAAANPGQTQAEFFISPDRWWNIYHNGNEASAVHCLLKYYGNSSQNNFYDPLFFEYLQANGLTENDIIMVYRPDGSTPWQEVEEYTVQTTSNVTNWLGEVTMMNIRSGQFAWAVRTGEISVDEKEKPLIDMYHNRHSIVVRPNHQQGTIRVFDMAGKLVMRKSVKEDITIATGNFAKGAYQAIWQGKDEARQVLRFVVE